jgi:hypothetical protein
MGGPPPAFGAHGFWESSAPRTGTAGSNSRSTTANTNKRRVVNADGQPLSPKDLG